MNAPRIRAGQPPSEGTASAQRLQGHFQRVDAAYLTESHARMVAGDIEQTSRTWSAHQADDEDEGAHPIDAWAEARLMLAAAIVVIATVAGVLWAARNWALGA